MFGCVSESQSLVWFVPFYVAAFGSIFISLFLRDCLQIDGKFEVLLVEH